MIYHILASDEWKSASRNEYYSPDSFGVDGFIHCCTEEQLEYVGERHFRGRQLLGDRDDAERKPGLRDGAVRGRPGAVDLRRVVSLVGSLSPEPPAAA